MPDHVSRLPPTEREIDEQVDQALDAGRIANREFGTRPTLTGTPAVEIASESVSRDPLARLERKIDSLTQDLAALKRTVDSIDEVLVKLIYR